MFKKIAHNSTLPALAGNNDLRPLQDLITAEKAVLTSLQKLSVDFSKASEALRAWGLGEGEDLGDTLSASTTVLSHFSSAISQYAAHGHVIRDHLKSVRTREEALDDLKRRRRNVLGKADSAEKKLSKMSPEHKNIAMQTDTLNKLRDEIRSLGAEIMLEEAALGDFKRSTTRAYMGLKFGGLMECCERGMIAGEFGKLIIAEVPEDVTQPGLPRNPYQGRSQTEYLVAEAHRRVNEVQLSTVPSHPSRDPNVLNQQLPGVPQQTDPYSNSPRTSTFQMNTQQGYFQENMNTPVGWPPNAPQTMPSMGMTGVQSNAQGSLPNQSYPSSGLGQSNIPSYMHPQVQEDRSVDDFGVNTRTPGLGDSSSAAAARFATFPVKMRQGAVGGLQLDNPPSLMNARHEPEQSFASSVAEALGTEPMSSPHDLHRVTSTSTYNEPILPAYERVASAQSTPPPQLPPANNAPSLGPQTLNAPLSHQRNFSGTSMDAQDGLAYMANDDHGDEPPSSEHSHSKRVRFGDVSDVDAELERRSLDQHLRMVSQEGVSQPQAENRGLDEHPSVEQSRQEIPPSPVYSPGPNAEVFSQSGNERDVNGSPAAETPRQLATEPLRLSSQRVPPPSVSTEEDERALNAAAAREISREMDSLTFNPSSSINFSPFSQQDSPTDQSRLGQPSAYQTQLSQPDTSPLQPPSAPFSRRSVSPHPYAELNLNSAHHTPAQAYAQSYQAPPPGSPVQAYQTPSTFNQGQTSPAQPFQQPYQSHFTQSQNSLQYDQPPSDVHVQPTSALPPRLQALAQADASSIPKNPRPPRFQLPPPHDGQGSPTNALPPRFQTQNQGTLPDHQLDPRFSPMSGAVPSNSTSPYRTPPEYPSNMSNSSFAKPMNSPVLGGPRTISAAAFKRPPPRQVSGEGLGIPETSGLQLKKHLPSSPYPQQRVGGDSAVTPGNGGLSKEGPSSGELDDEYDYIGSYMNSDGGNGNTQRGDGPPSTGYSEGRFATDLEGTLR